MTYFEMVVVFKSASKVFVPGSATLFPAPGYAGSGCD